MNFVVPAAQGSKYVRLSAMPARRPPRGIFRTGTYPFSALIFMGEPTPRPRSSFDPYLPFTTLSAMKLISEMMAVVTGFTPE